MRKLVTCRVIDKIEPIENANNIECVSVDGWNVVAQKGLHSQGDTVLFFEIDSFLPKSDVRFESFMAFGVTTFNGVEGHRVKTKKLRGVYSQGVIMPVSEFPEISPEFDRDFSVDIGVLKYEKQEVTGYQGNPKGSFPGFLRKSDQERIQNLYSKIRWMKENSEELFVGTLKMDGSSVTVFYDELSDELGVCSRNMQLKYDPEIDVEEQGRFIQGVVKEDLLNTVKSIHEGEGGSWALQGELVGPGIQGGFEKFDQYRVFVYNIFNIDKQEYLNYEDFDKMIQKYRINVVPVIYESVPVLKLHLEDILKMSDGPSIINKRREGIVWKGLKTNIQFKAISNKYLEKEEGEC